MIKRITVILLLSILSLAGCNQPVAAPSEETPSGGESSGGGGGDPVTPPPSGPTKVSVNKHTLSDGNPPIDINSDGQSVSKATWNSFKGAPASKFNNHYNYTYRYYVSGQTTYETFTKNGYKLSNSTGLYYYERINNKLYQYNSTKDGYERVLSSYDFINHRNEVLAHEVYVHMFDYDEYTYNGDFDGSYTYNTSAFSTEIKFQDGYLTYLRYTLNSPLSTFEIFNSFESIIEIPKSYYYQS